MSVSTQQVPVNDRASLDQAVTAYIAQGFTVQHRGEDFATMYRKKEFSIPIAVIGFLFCVVGLVVYTIVYAFQSDKLVEVRIAGSYATAQPTAALTPGAEAGVPGGREWSPDGRYWWDGAAWQDAHESLPSDAQVSEDRTQLWDGTAWRSTAGLPQSVLSTIAVYGAAPEASTSLFGDAEPPTATYEAPAAPEPAPPSAGVFFGDPLAGAPNPQPEPQPAKPASSDDTPLPPTDGSGRITLTFDDEPGA